MCTLYYIGGKCLTDEHTHLAQSLLTFQFPHINGMQCSYIE